MAVAVLLDIDGVLYVGNEPIAGAITALADLRRLSTGVRLVTNTTSKSRREIFEHLRALGFEVDEREVLTPAALALRHCRERGHRSVRLLVADALLEDLDGLAQAPSGQQVDAIVLGDLGDGFTREVLNEAFLVLDVGAYSAALEYASGIEAVVVGKPAPAFFAAALGDLHAQPREAVMIGDDVEADVGGA